MWIFDENFKKWTYKDDVITKDAFESYQQEQSSFRFYSKCLSGATFLPVNNLDSIYDILDNDNNKDWYISPVSGSIYSKTSFPFENPAPITIDNSDDFYIKNNSEYSLTLKNKFTPERLIKESIDNFLTVDVATVESIDLTNPPDRIDGVRLIENHRILIKNQTSSSILPINTDPNLVFKGNFEVVEVFGSTIEYRFFDETNGIYQFKSGQFVKQNDLDDYKKAIRYSVSVKLGDINRDKQFHLSRLRSGYYPVPGEPIEFVEKKNWLLRNRLDYNNIFDLNLYDVIAHGTQSYNFQGITYSIPERVIAVGEFGSIINNQFGISNIISNNYKVNLRNITQTQIYYWIVGDGGLLLRIRKHDFDVRKIELNTLSNLKSIDFFNDLNGVLVGDINTIIITNNGGFTWERIKIDAFDAFRFNKVLYKKSNRFYVAGDNGVFINFTRDLSGWTAFKRRISRFEDSEDDYILVDDINDMIYTEINTWGLSYSFKNTPTSIDKEIIIMTTNDSKIIIHDLNSSIPFTTEFFYLTLNKDYGDIINITRRSNTNDIFFTAIDGIFKLDLSTFDLVGINDPLSNSIISSQSVSIDKVSDIFTNTLLDYNDNLIIVGNNSIFEKSSYSQTMSFSQMDPQFDSRLKSRMLFLDYDIGAKLNFFTDEGEYRLPNSISLTFVNSNIDITTITQSEVNWFTYWQDRQMTFEYHTPNAISDQTKVLMSSFFTYNQSIQKERITGADVINTLSAIQNLAPNLGNPNSSRFYGIQTITETANTNFKLYLYDYLMIYRVAASYSVKKGDVIRLESSLISHNFIVNKILTFGNNKYIYMFTDFNQSIITDMLRQNPIFITNLNTFSNISDFFDNFKNHPISIGYSINRKSNTEIEIKANFNNLTAYYNMAMSFKVAGHGEYTMRYKNSFLNFGYTPTYNILDFLNRLDSNFNPNKEYLSMPVYQGIPVVRLQQSTVIDDSKIYIDTDNRNNKIFFGSKLEFEWNSFFLNTFIDVVITTNNIDSRADKLLVNNKFKIENFRGARVFVIELNNSIPQVILNANSTINLESRRKLSQISSDLQVLNNIHRPLTSVNYNNQNYGGQETIFSRYEPDLNFRINTNSYANILLSDLQTKKSLTAIVYIDDKNELSVNINRIDSNSAIDIQNTGIVTSGTFLGKLIIFCANDHNLSVSDGIILEFTGPPGSSSELNPQYFGFRNVISIINEKDFIVDIDYGNVPQVGNDVGIVKFVKKDPFLNYQPLDIIDVGIDKRGKIAVELNNSNLLVVGNRASLINVDFNKFRFRLIDGLNIEVLAKDYSWIYEAEISGAVIGLINNQLVWYKGTWECGRWFGGRWISGTWISGDWYGGIWESKLIKDNWINVETDDKSSNLTSSNWLNGRWFDGVWNNGTWVNGRWYSGEWNNGRWFDGIWNEGIWNSGIFTSGIWIFGTWNGGKFNTENGPVYWLDGDWNSGDFENGIWYNGNFDEKLGESRFGIKSYNSRNSIWLSGNWISGSFHSRLNTNIDGDYDVSDIHKYSIWKTGNWFSGNWYGGIAYNIDFKSGVWHGGILEDIEVIGFNQTIQRVPIQNEIILNGVFDFNIGNIIFIIGDSATYSSVGSDDSPKRYTILNYIEQNGKTKIYVDSIIPFTTGDIYTGLRVVSIFRNCNWKSGIWNNGIYENGILEGVIWYNGIFSGNWK